MKEIYVRTNQVQEIIKDIKLTVNAWKLLFAIDGDTELEKLNLILGLDENEVKISIQELIDIDLIKPLSSAASDTKEGFTKEEVIEKKPKVKEEKKQPVEEDFSFEDPNEDDGLKPENNEVAEDDLEALLSDESKLSDFDMDSAEGEISTETVETGPDLVEEEEEEELDDLVSQIIEQDEDEDLFSEGNSDEEIDELVDSNPMAEQNESAFEHTEEDLEDFGEEIDEDDLIADLEKDIQDFMLEEDMEDTAETMIEDDPLSGIDEEELTMPMVEEEPVAPVAPTPPPPQSGERKTVLVVDDSVVIRKMIEIALENDPFNVVAAPTGKEALEIIDSQNINIIILDLILPDLNGLDVLKAVKASSNIPVIILTGKDAPKEIQKAKEHGVDEFLTKPFKDDELVTKVKTLVI